jgi:hypothetical protein
LEETPWRAAWIAADAFIRCCFKQGVLFIAAGIDVHHLTAGLV